MNANYRKNERLLEKNPTPIDIGLSEDVKEYVDSQIIQELPEYTTSDDGKVLGVTVDSSGEEPVAEVEWVEPAGGLPEIVSGDAGKVLAVNNGETGTEWIISGYTFVKQANLTGTNIQPGGVYNATISLSGDGYNISDNDFIVIAKPASTALIESVNDSNKTSITVQCKNLGTGYESQFGSYYVYRKPKTSTNNHISFIGGIGLGCRIMELPTTLGTAGQVLAVNSGANGVEWINASSGYEFVESMQIKTPNNPIDTNYEDYKTPFLTGGTDYDFILVPIVNDYFTVKSSYTSGSSSATIFYKYTGPSISGETVIGNIRVYRKPKSGSLNAIMVLSGVSLKCVRASELPSYSSADSGKVLSVNASGQLEWITPGS